MFSVTKIKNNLKNQEKGFSLVEVLIYSGMLILITFFIVQSIIALVKSHSKVVLDRSVEYSSEAAINKIIGEIKNASSVNTGSSSFGTNPGTLSLNGTENSVSYTIAFSVQNGAIVFSKDGGVSVPLTSSDVSVTSMIFKIASTTNSIAIKVDATIYGTKRDYSKTLNLSDFAILRGSY